MSLTRIMPRNAVLFILFGVLFFPCVLKADESPALPRFRAASETIGAQLREHKFSEAKALFSTALKTQQRTRGGHLYAAGVLDELFPPPTEAFDSIPLEAIQSWITTEPDTALPHTIAGAFYLSRAFHTRGLGADSEVRAESWVPFRGDLKLAAASLDEALRLDATHPLALIWRLRVASARKEGNKTLSEFFTRAAASYRDAILAHRIRLQTLGPARGGSQVELLSFARNATAKARARSAMPILIPLAHEQLAVHSGGFRDYLSRPDVWPEVEEAWQSLAKRFPKAGLYLIQFAKHAYAAGQKKQAAELRKRALEVEPNNVEIHLSLASFYLHQERDTDLALKHLDRALELRPNIAHASLSRGMLYSEKKNFQRAETDFRRANKLDQRNSYSRYQLARLLLLRQNDFAEAARFYAEAIALQPAVDRYHSEYCYALLGLKKVKTAARECSIAIGLNPNNVNAFRNRSTAYSRLGEKRKALQDTRAANRLERKREVLEKSGSI